MLFAARRTTSLPRIFSRISSDLEIGYVAAHLFVVNYIFTEIFSSDIIYLKGDVEKIL